MNKDHAYFLKHISRSPTEAECATLAALMREEDKEEILAAVGSKHLPPWPEFLCREVQASDQAVVIYEPDTGIPMGIYGASRVDDIPGADPAVVPDPGPGVGIVWMQATPALAGRYKLDFLRLCRFGLAELRQRYRLLICWADSRNALHIRWLRWMGFTPLIPRYLHDKTVPFLEFVLPGEG